MFSVAVCDDDELLCEKIEACLKAYRPEGLIRCESYYSGEKLYQAMLRGETFDLIFLDIELKAMNGVNLGDKIRRELQNEKTHIVYISAKSEYAMELFAVRPLNFLVKPVQEQDVINNLEKAMKLSKYYDGYLKFQKGSDFYSIAYEDILYFSTSGRKIRVHTDPCEYEFYGKLDDLLQRIPPGFIRIHKSYLVNELYVKKWGYEAVIMTDDTELSISKRYRKAVRDSLLKRLQEE